MPVVLLVLGAVHARVVGGDDDATSVDASVGEGEQGVGGHVEAHVLHDGNGPTSCVGGAKGHLQGHLLVRAPLGIDLWVLHNVLEDLSGGRARVAGSHLDARLEYPLGYRLVARKEFTHLSSPGWME